MNWFRAWTIVLAALSVSSANAADMAVNAPIKAPPPAVFSWTGCYVGGNVGWIGGLDDYDLGMAGGFLTPPNGFATNPSARALLAHSYSPNASGVSGGVQAGCNYQSGTFVLGVEAGINGTSLGERINAAYGPTGGNSPSSSHTEFVTKDLNWFSTFRARAGFAMGRALIYGTGGLAVGNYRSSTLLQFNNDPLFLSGSTFPGSFSETRVGWAAGAGIEWAFANNWAVRAEYLYLDFGRFSYKFNCTDAPCVTSFTNAGLPLGAWSTSVHARENIVRLGVNYMFGGPVVAKY